MAPRAAGFIRRSPWPAVVLILALALSSGIFFGMRSYETAQHQGQADAVAREWLERIAQQIRSETRAVDRMAHRWETRGATPEMDWRADAVFYLEDLPALVALGWSDARHVVRWVEDRRGRTDAVDFDIKTRPERMVQLQALQHRHEAGSSGPLTLFHGPKGFIYDIPLLSLQEETAGFLHAVFDYRRLIALLSRQTGSDSHIRLTVDGTIVFGDLDAGSDDLTGSARRDILGENWRLQVVAPPLTDSRALTWWGLVIATLLMGAAALAAAALHYRAEGAIKTEHARIARQRLQDAIDALDTPFAYYDRNDRLRIWNRAFIDLNFKIGERICEGLSYRKLLEMIIDSGQSADSLDNPAQYRIDRLAMHRQSNFAVERQLTNGRWVISREQRTSDGGVAALWNDITELKTRQFELERERNRAEAANRAKSDFLANMSHELRTPLNAVIGYADIMTDGSDAEISSRFRGFARDIMASGRHLLELINDLLDSAKIEAGQMTLSNQTLPLLSELRDTIALIVPLGEQRDVTIELRPDPASMTAAITADPRAFRQIVLNLLSNAVKFSPAGSTVTLAIEARDADMALSVLDRGPGIAPEDLERVFERFVQAGDSEAAVTDGTGIGLPLSRALAELLGGRLELESRPDRGTTAILTLPNCLSDAADPETGRDRDGTGDGAAGEKKRFAGRRILLAEDHPVNRALMCEILERDGCVVHTAENGTLALAAFVREPFDLVFMDVQMPEMDGLEATRKIRAHEDPDRRTPIIAATANAFEAQRRQCLEAGMDDHITKPITREAVRHMLRRWLAGQPLSGREPMPVESAPPVQNPSDDVPLIDRAMLQEMLDLVGCDTVAEIVEQLREDCSKRLAELQAGVERQDTHLIGTQAHSLKGAFANIGGQRVSDLAAELERRGKAGDLAGVEAILGDFSLTCESTLEALRATVRRAAA